MILSWFENLILLIAGVLGCPALETLGAFSFKPVRVAAEETLIVRTSRGVRGAMTIPARRPSRVSAGQ